MKHSDRAGLTIIEILVTISVVGILACVILSAIGSARESTRRVQCANNLGQFGRALQAYESAKRVFPPAMAAVGNDPKKPSDLWYAPHVALLPYVEQSAIAANVNPQQSFLPNLQSPGTPTGAWPGTMVPWTRLPVFRCPSDGNAAGSWAGNSYRVCTGPGPVAHTSTEDGPGAFLELRSRRPAEFTDGLSTTVGAAEKLFGQGGSSFSRGTDFWYSGAWMLGAKTPDQMAAYCGSVTGTPPQYYVYSGATWFFAGYENSWYNHVLAPNAAVPDCSWDFIPAGQSPTGGGAFRASSNHPGGVNSMYMDGSVRFANDNISLAIWRAVSTRAGAEAIGIDAN